MAETEKFAHGSYADYSGVNFYGPPVHGMWLDQLAVSYRYMNPLFLGILDRSWRESGGEQVPRLVSEWCQLIGWADGSRRTLIDRNDAWELVATLTQLDSTDIVEHCAGCTVEECLECAAVIREFISCRLSSGVSLFMEYN